MRAAIYARFSTEHQSERSIDDQLALCRTFAKTQKLNVVAEFEDRARSGGSTFGRDGLAAMLDGARERRFEVLIVEALDRLSRDMEDLAGMHKRLTFAGVKILAVHEGEANTVLVGLRGLVGQLFREDGIHKVRRGMSGRVRDGMAAGGRAYGYRPGSKIGTLEIVEAEAEVVRRIFRDYVSGKNPREIAHDLNREKTKPPRGKVWNASTINGSAQRHNGILRNEIYAGRIVWNRVRMVKNPDTGKRLSRPNPRDEWLSAEVPALRILDRDLFDKAQKKKSAAAHASGAQRRRSKTILSGLLRCGACGGGMVVKGADKTGRARIRCSTDKESGTCKAPQTYYLDVIERRVLDALHAELRDPRVIAEFAAGYREERRRLANKNSRSRAKMETRLGAVERELKQLIDAIAKGVAGETIVEQVRVLENERNEIREALREKPAAEIVELHPATVGNYEARLADLKTRVECGLATGDSDATEAADALRELVETVTIKATPGKAPGFKAEISGRLDPLFGPMLAGLSGLTVVAGGRYSLKAHSFLLVA